jgi:hypothetical protein
MICNAIVVLIEVSLFQTSRARSCNDHIDHYSQTAYEVDESHKSLADFFDRLQYYLQRVYDCYDPNSVTVTFTEFSNIAGIKLLLLKVMAEALSTVVDYTKVMREKPISRLIC